MALRGEIRSPESLGLMLKQARQLRGVTQRQLAEELHIEQRRIWEMETGKTNRFVDRLFKILRATGCKIYIEIDSEAKKPRG